jgi:hypothetical protein
MSDSMKPDRTWHDIAMEMSAVYRIRQAIDDCNG